MRMRYPGGWNKDKWRVTQPGNRKWFYAEHDNGVMLWLTDPGGRGDNWSVKAGTGTRLNQSSHVASGIPNKQMAEGVIQEVMKKHSTDPDYRKMRMGTRGAFDF